MTTKKSSAGDVDITDLTPETTGQPLTSEQIAADAHRQKLAMFAASCNRERQRIATEHGVRLGDSIIHERGFCEAISEVLAEFEDKYLQLSKP